MDLEAVFQELGQFGRYQVLQYTLLTIPFIASAFEEISYIFTTSQVSYRCLVPECEAANATQFSPQWLPEAVPYDPATGDPQWCHRYAPRYHNHTSCAFLTNITVSCEEWLFATQERTVATEFKLLCKENVWRRTIAGTVNNIGLITNYIVVCHLSDRFGRKTVLISLSVAQGILAILQSFSPTYPVFLIFEYLICFCSTYNSAFILGIEVVGGDKRMFANCLMNSLYSLGEVVVALLMWWFQDFRLLLRFIGTIKLTNVLSLWLVSESVHWYLSKERYKDVVRVVKRISQCNQKDMSDAVQNDLDTLQAKGVKMKEAELKEPSQRSVIKELLRSPPLLKRFAICSLTWLVNVFVYFGFSLMSVTLAGNKYVNFMLIALVEIPAYVTMWLSMEYCRLGRKTALELSSFAASVPCLVYLFVPSDATLTRLSLCLLGKFAITVSYTVVYEVGAEVFPTELRQSMVGLCCAVACVGGLFAPQIPLLALYINPLLLFFCLSVTAGCLSLLLPETKGQGLPSTIVQAEKMGK